MYQPYATNTVELGKTMDPGLSNSGRLGMFKKNEAQALAYGDPRMELKKLDRPGISRGAGQMNVAQNNATGQMMDALAQAYNEDRSLQTQQALNMLEGQSQDVGYGQQLGGFQSNDYYANAMNQIASRQAGLNLITSLLGGLLS